MMARFENQKALNTYMDEMPFGIGMGAIDEMCIRDRYTTPDVPAVEAISPGLNTLSDKALLG